MRGVMHPIFQTISSRITLGTQYFPLLCRGTLGSVYAYDLNGSVYGVYILTWRNFIRNNLWIFFKLFPRVLWNNTTQREALVLPKFQTFKHIFLGNLTFDFPPIAYVIIPNKKDLRYAKSEYNPLAAYYVDWILGWEYFSITFIKAKKPCQIHLMPNFMHVICTFAHRKSSTNDF